MGGEETTSVGGAAAARHEPQDGGAVLVWLVEEVARLAGVSPARVDPAKAIASYALDSLAAVELAHAVETRLGVSVPMAALFSDLTVANLAASLAAERPP